MRSGGSFIGYDHDNKYGGTASRGEFARSTNTINTGLRAISGIRTPVVKENNDEPAATGDIGDEDHGLSLG